MVWFRSLLQRILFVTKHTQINEGKEGNTFAENPVQMDKINKK